MAHDRLVFSSKTDLWLLIVLLAVPVSCFLVFAQFWRELTGALWWAGLMLAAAAILPLWLLVATRYSMSDSELFVRCGPFRWIVPIADITNVERTRNPRSNPALSLDRIRIDYGEAGSILISPEPRDAFLRQLEHRRKAATG